MEQVSFIPDPGHILLQTYFPDGKGHFLHFEGMAVGLDRTLFRWLILRQAQIGNLRWWFPQAVSIAKGEASPRHDTRSFVFFSLPSTNYVPSLKAYELDVIRVSMPVISPRMKDYPVQITNSACNSQLTYGIARSDGQA